MRIQSEEHRLSAEATLKEVMTKLEEALRLAREQERAQQDERCKVGANG